MITIIAATDLNGGIGNAGAIPWKVPEDLRYFKAITTGHPIVMGRKTHESIGKPLPKRDNVVVTRQQRAYAGCVTVLTLEAAFILAKQLSADGEFFVIGGAEIYAQTLAAADQLLLTVVGGTYACDTHFPPDLGRDWLVAVVGRVPAQNSNPSLTFLRLEPCADAAHARWIGLSTARSLQDVLDHVRHLP